MAGTIGPLIINGPHEEPERHWRYARENRTFSLEPGRRPAGYVVATPGSKSFDDPGVFVPLPLVNRIRPRVAAWREGATPVSPAPRCGSSGTGATRRPARRGGSSSASGQLLRPL